MSWTCSESDHSEPFDPPRTTDNGEPLCESCADDFSPVRNESAVERNVALVFGIGI
jgi:hypothetical protein